MYHSLEKREKNWINRLFDVSFKGKDILWEQISKAKIHIIQGYDYISLEFHVADNVTLYPYKVRVPIEMRAFQSSSEPIVFLLHLIDGKINELEIFTAGLSQINPDTIELDRVSYEINKEIL